MWYLLKFTDEIFDSCIDFVCAGCLRHGELGWKKDDLFCWDGGSCVWHEDVALSAVVHCWSHMPSINASVCPSCLTLFFGLMSDALGTKWGQWIAIEVVQTKDLVMA